MSVEIAGVSKGFATSTSQIEVLKNLSVKIETGEVAAIVGQSGSGKSTLLSLIAGMDKPDSGKIIIGDTAIEKMNEDELTSIRGRKIGIIFQQFHLIDSLTAIENVSLPYELMHSNSNYEKAEKFLNEVGLKDRHAHFPGQLSGGEKQRVAIARSLMLDPEILLADEPTGNLDAETSEKVVDVMFDIIRRHKITTLIVTHNLELAEKCDKTYILNHGVLTAK